MRGLLWIGIALLAVSPLVAQEDEEGGFFGGFGPGDESDLPQAETRGRSEQRQGPNPVDELDAILSKLVLEVRDSGLPLALVELRVRGRRADGAVPSPHRVSPGCAAKAPTQRGGRKRDSSRISCPY
jgi:hypothetical protein